MLEILEIPEIRKRIAPITIERYHRMIKLGVFDEWPVELLNGVLVEKMSKSELHVYLVHWLLQALNRLCPADQFLVRKEDPITIGNSEPEPDLSVVEGTLAEYRHAKPSTARFVIEVSISTAGLDRAKATEYAKAEVPEDRIVLPEEQQTEVYRSPVDGEYTDVLKVPADTMLQSSAIPGFSFHLAEALAE